MDECKKRELGLNLERRIYNFPFFATTIGVEWYNLFYLFSDLQSNIFHGGFAVILLGRISGWITDSQLRGEDYKSASV